MQAPPVVHHKIAGVVLDVLHIPKSARIKVDTYRIILEQTNGEVIVGKSFNKPDVTKGDTAVGVLEVTSRGFKNYIFLEKSTKKKVAVKRPPANPKKDAPSVSGKRSTGGKRLLATPVPLSSSESSDDETQARSVPVNTQHTTLAEEEMSEMLSLAQYGIH